MRRWFVLLFFCLFNLSNNLQWITFSTVVDDTKKYFNCDSFEVNSLAWIYSLVYVVLAIPSSGLYDKFGLRNGMILGSVLNALGSILKLVAVYVFPNFGMLFVAQLFNAVAQCFTLGLPPMVAASWFGTDERSLATSLAAVANILGVAVGFPVPPMMVTGGDNANLKDQFGGLFGFEAALCTVTAVGIICVVADCPPNAPSITSRRRTDPVPLIPSLMDLLRNKSFLLLAVTMGFSNGMYGGLSTVMAQINQPFGISNNQTGWIGCVGSFASVTGSVVIGLIIDRVRRYKLPLLVLSLSITVCLTAVLVAFAISSAPLLNAYVWFTLLQIIEACVCAVVFEYSVELTYPIPEAFSGTALMVLPNLFNFVIVLSSSALLGNNPTQGQALSSLAICVFVAFLSGFACLFLREDLKRVELESAKIALDS